MTGLRSSSLIVLILLFISAITFSFAPTYTTRIIGWLALAFIVVLSLFHFSIQFSKTFRFVLCLLGIYFLGTFASLLWASDFDFYLVRNASGIFLHLIPGAVIIYCLHRHLFFGKHPVSEDFDEVQVFFYLQGALFILAFLACIAFISPGARAVFEALVSQAGNIDPFHHQYVYRVRGILNSVGAGASIIYALGVMISIYLYFYVKRIGVLFFLASVLALSVAVLVSGRAGLFALLLVAVCVLGYYLFQILMKAMFQLRLEARGLFSVSLVFVLLSGFWVLVLNINTASEWLAWIFQEFYYIFTFQFDEGTIGVLINSHMVLPPDSRPLNLLAGDQSYFDLNRVQTDIGYLRMFYASGVIAIVYYGVMALMFYYSCRDAKRSSTKRLIQLIMVVAFVFELKEPFMIDLRFTTIYFLIYVFVSVKPRLKKRQNVDLQNCIHREHAPSLRSDQSTLQSY
jgi:hypothetical protein